MRHLHSFSRSLPQTVRMLHRWCRRPGTKAPPAPHYEPDPRVPPLSAWPDLGIVGRIGSGPHAGELVFAHTFHDAPGDTFAGYELCLPVQRLFEAGRHLVDDGVVDTRMPGAEGGLIDELTRGADVTWMADEGVNRAAFAAHDADRHRPHQQS